jgi:hypothetical protein
VVDVAFVVEEVAVGVVLVVDALAGIVSRFIALPDVVVAASAVPAPFLVALRTHDRHAAVLKYKNKAGEVK